MNISRQGWTKPVENCTVLLILEYYTQANYQMLTKLRYFETCISQMFYTIFQKLLDLFLQNEGENQETRSYGIQETVDAIQKSS